jgi:hypothetical protein
LGLEDLQKQDKPTHLPACPKGQHWDTHLSKCVPGDGPSKPKPPVLPGVAFQLISNMVSSLSGDLKDKYPSAELLKIQLKALWECLYDKQQHHGMWKDNFTIRTVEREEDDKCLLDGEVDPAPKTIKVITPVDVGSTVFNMIEGKKCLFESLVDNNTTEPTKLSVLQGKWINYCDVKDVIDCVLPRKIITDCHDKCDDPNHDGVHEDPTLCECTICKVVDTYSIDLTKTKLPGTGNSIKADLIHQNTSCIKLAVDSKGLKADAVISPKAGNKLTCTPDGLFVAKPVPPFFATAHVRNDSVKKIQIGSSNVAFGNVSITIDPVDYPIFATAGNKVSVAIVYTWDGCVTGVSGDPRWSIVVALDGHVIKPHDSLMAGIDGTGSNQVYTDTYAFTLTTTGHPMTISVNSEGNVVGGTGLYEPDVTTAVFTLGSGDSTKIKTSFVP